MLASTTAYYAMAIYSEQKDIIDNAGSTTLQASEDPISFAANVLVTLNTFLADALMVRLHFWSTDSYAPLCF
jgi:hypothetical protein